MRFINTAVSQLTASSPVAGRCLACLRLSHCLVPLLSLLVSGELSIGFITRTHLFTRIMQTGCGWTGVYKSCRKDYTYWCTSVLLYPPQRLVIMQGTPSDPCCSEMCHSMLLFGYKKPNLQIVILSQRPQQCPHTSKCPV